MDTQRDTLKGVAFHLLLLPIAQSAYSTSRLVRSLGFAFVTSSNGPTFPFTSSSSKSQEFVRDGSDYRLRCNYTHIRAHIGEKQESSEVVNERSEMSAYDRLMSSRKISTWIINIKKRTG